MYKIHIAAVILSLVIVTSCDVQDRESQDVRFKESTPDAIKVIGKRQAIEASADVGAAPVGDNVLGIGSVGIQVLGGLLENMLSTNGVNSQAVTSLINLFSPEKIRNDLILVRRVFNLFARFGTVLNRYLPAPPTSGYGFKPLDLLSSKVRLYTPEPSDNLRWVPVNKTGIIKPISPVPSRVQTVADYVTQRPLVTSTADALDLSNELETNKNVDEVQTVIETSKDENSGAEEIETSISTNSSQDDKAEDQTMQLESMDDNKRENISYADDLLLVDTQKVTPTSIVEEKKPNIDNQSKPYPYVKDSLPAEENPPSGEINDLLPKENKGQKNEIVEENQKPSGGVTESKNDKISFESATVPAEIRAFDEYGLPGPDKISIPFRPYQEYGVPEQIFNNNRKGRRRDKTGLPLRNRDEVFAVLPHFRRDETKEEANNYVDIAQVPLERHTIFDRMHGPLKDSFGLPVRN